MKALKLESRKFFWKPKEKIKVALHGGSVLSFFVLKTAT